MHISRTKILQPLITDAIYDIAEGEDLMITGTESSPENVDESVPVLKLDATLGSFITIEWKKSGFDALELQYRKAGTEMWQAAEKSTEKIIEFQPTGTIPGTPEKYEFRAVFLQKNQRVGQWSAIYSITIG